MSLNNCTANDHQVRFVEKENTMICRSSNLCQTISRVACCLSVCLIATMALTQSAMAIPMKVDFGDIGQVVDTGNDWVGFAIPDSPAQTYMMSYPSAVGTSGTVNVDLIGQGAFLSRIRPAVTFQPDLNLMLSTVIYNNTNDMTVRFKNLREGTYEVNTYHHDSIVQQNGIFNIEVTDANNTGLIVASGLTSTTGTNPGSVSSSSFSFYANGTDPVDILIDHTSGVLTSLSGISLEFTPVPEPSSLMLLGLGGLGLIRYHRRRRVKA